MTEADFSEERLKRARGSWLIAEYFKIKEMLGYLQYYSPEDREVFKSNLEMIEGELDARILPRC